MTSSSACACCMARGVCASCLARPGCFQQPGFASEFEPAHMPRVELLGEVRSLRRERDELLRLVLSQEVDFEEPGLPLAPAELRGRSAHTRKSYGRDRGLRIASLERRLEHEKLVAAQEATATAQPLFNGTAAASVAAASAAAAARQGADAAELAALEVASAQAFRTRVPTLFPWRPPGHVSSGFDGGGGSAIRSSSRGRPPPLSAASPGAQFGLHDPEVFASEQLDVAIDALSSARGALTGAARQLSMNAQHHSADAWRAHGKSRQMVQQISEEAWRMRQLEQAMGASAESFERQLRALSADRVPHSTRRPHSRGGLGTGFR